MICFFFKGGSTVIQKFLLPPEKYIGMKLMLITEIRHRELLSHFAFNVPLSRENRRQFQARQQNWGDF